MGARVKKTARERLDEMRMVDGATNSQTSDGLDVGISGSGVQRTGNKRKRSSNFIKEGLDRKRVTSKDRKDLARTLPWQPPQQSSQATIKHAPLFGHASGIPLAVLHAVSSGQPWQSSVAQSVLSYPGVSVPAVPMAASDPNHVTLQSSTVSPNNQAVVKTLAALGIPIPSKREETAARLAMPNVLIPSPTKAMTMDQLRRTIALRETSNAAGKEASLGMQQQQPMQLPLTHSQQAIGKYTGNQHNAGVYPIPHLPVPNDNNHVNHGAKCS